MLGVIQVTNMHDFNQKIEKVYKNTQALNQHINESPLQEQDLLIKALEELHIALEELQVAEEELREQNHILAEAHYSLAQERQRYQELFDLAPDGYIVTDIEGKIQAANNAAAEMLNIPKHFITGKFLVNFIPESERRAFRSLLLRQHQPRRVSEWETRIQPRHSHITYVSISRTTITDNKGQIQGWRWMLRDITERKQTEEQLRAVQVQNLQLEEAAKLKSQFIAIMSHELRTPLHAILGFANLLQRQVQQWSSSSSPMMLEKIINNGKQLLTLIEDMLDLSKLESNRLKLQLQKFNLIELVTSTVNELRPIAEKKNLKLNLNIEIDNNIVINDSIRVKQIIVNLLDNAIKFTDTGSINIDVKELLQDKLSICVCDTGIGISEEDLKYIFQAFRQINQTTIRKYNGTGLGLAIIDHLVRLMQGTISVTSTVGEGSTFCVEIPKVVTNQG
ncbi:PAS/PAC sensor signal transduction histidine kinase [Calothrix sp. NIES-4071]|nr:PAS/PAC sensor signal transduction histidine kinase [Calothrix sp. NIES-4071]BAZ58550.1 PAS/PAC sensor signal transduction histidine kinase [Calothrix sp. NIES-4105]